MGEGAPADGIPALQTNVRAFRRETLWTTVTPKVRPPDGSLAGVAL